MSLKSNQHPDPRREETVASLPEIAWTAYALGELEGSEAEAVAQRVQSDRRAAYEVEEARRLGERLGRALRAAPELRLSLDHVMAVEGHLRTLEQAQLAEQVRLAAPQPPRVHPFDRRRRASLGLALAAAAVVVFAGAAGAFYASYEHARRSLMQGSEAGALVMDSSGASVLVHRRDGAARSLRGAWARLATSSEHPFVEVRQHPLSGFAAAVSDEAYQQLLVELERDRLPAPKGVRIEEYVNAFRYRYAPPESPEDRFASHTEVQPCPWNPESKLARIALKGATQGVAADRPLAEDLTVRVEFNPAKVAAYRLVGFENRGQDGPAAPSGQRVDAGHEVTAFYEIVPAGDLQGIERLSPLDQLRYQHTGPMKTDAKSNELFTVNLRYRPGDAPAGTPQQIEHYPVPDSDGERSPSSDFEFSAAVASFGQLLSESPHRGRATFDSVLEDAARGVARAQETPGTGDASGRAMRERFLEVVRKAKSLKERAGAR